MAEVDCQVDLVVLWDVYQVLLVLHVHCHELVADFWGVFGVVHDAEVLCLDVILQFWIVVQSDGFTFNFLSPSVLIEALSEEDNVGQNSSVVVLVDSVAHSVEVEGEDLVNKHVLSVFVGQIVVKSVPFFCFGSCWYH